MAVFIDTHYGSIYPPSVRQTPVIIQGLETFPKRVIILAQNFNMHGLIGLLKCTVTEVVLFVSFNTRYNV